MLDKRTYRALKQEITIDESHEPMLRLEDTFLRFTPHPYESLGAPYQEKSPFFVREDVLARLHKAAYRLESLKKGYKLKIFDAYRPLAVQEFMIEFDTNKTALEMFGLEYEKLLKEQQQEVKTLISRFWSPVPEDVFLNPPPHSTGGALDLTIVDEKGTALDMGTEIDELIDAAASDFYDNTQSLYEKNRNLLVEVMSYADFTQLPTEWWHFSYGDQIWAVDKSSSANSSICAKYGLV